jgi:hypothetical protein
MSALGVAPAADRPSMLADLVVARPGLAQHPRMRFALGPADRALVTVGQTVYVGEPLLERVPDAVVVDAGPGGTEHLAPGDPLGPDIAPAADAPTGIALAGHGRALYRLPDGRLRVALGERATTVASPIRGVVVEQSAARLVLEGEGLALPGTLAAGEPTHGELVMAVAGPDGELPPSAIDVGSHGAILVAGARIDLEALGRARAMGVRGVVVGGLVSRDLRGFRASEVRQRAALHGGPPFAVLVLDGYGKRPIAPSIWARLLAAAGRDVAIGVDPPQLLLPADLDLPAGRPDRVRICGGTSAGREGSFIRAVGRVRWAGGLEADGGLVRVDPLEGEGEGDGGGADHDLLVPLADLEAL